MTSADQSSIEINDTMDFSFQCFKMVQTLQAEISKALNAQKKGQDPTKVPTSFLPHIPFEYDPFTSPCCSYMTPNWVEPGSKNMNANQINYRAAATQSLLELEKKVSRLNLLGMNKTMQAIHDMRSLLEHEF